MLLVIDALDKSQVDDKSELLKLMGEEIKILPSWIKIFITSRPELPVQEEFKKMNPIKITTDPRNENNEEDLRKYLKHQLIFCRSEKSEFSLSDDVLDLLVRKCERYFLHALHAKNKLQKKNFALTNESINQLVPLGSRGFYKKEFYHVEELLNTINLSMKTIILTNENFNNFLEMLMAYRLFLPLFILFNCLGFPVDVNFEVRSNII